MTTLRRQARSFALQILYRFDVESTGVSSKKGSTLVKNPPEKGVPVNRPAGEGIDPVAEGVARERFWADSKASKKARAFADALVDTVVANRETVDEALQGVLEQWKLSRLPVMVRLILRLAACELIIQGTEPPPVIINEAMELTRTYMDEESVKFVNSVLDRLRRRRDGESDSSAPEGGTLPRPPHVAKSG